MNKLKIGLAIVLKACFSNVVAQNLIVNGDFETSLSDPEIINSSNNFTCSHWFSPSLGTPDYFKSHRNGLFGVRNNLFGDIIPYNGHAYAGFGSNMGGFRFFEYLEIQLLEKMEKGSFYCLSFIVSATNKTYHFTTNEIDIAFTSMELNENTGYMIKPNKFVTIVDSAHYFRTSKWSRVTTKYLAEGDENYLTIGLFNKNYSKLNLSDKKNKKFDGVYLFIDDVRLTKVINESECDCSKFKLLNYFDLALENRQLLRNTTFGINDFKLDTLAKLELEELGLYLKENPEYNIELIGYADSTGNKSENLSLSKKRAKAVADYLYQMKIPAKRIVYYGLGEIGNKDHSYARRVEYIIRMNNK